MRFAIVAAKFNTEITTKLHESCVETLKHAGVAPDKIDTVWVPGSYELPWAVNEMALSGRYEAVIAIGCIMKGQTPQNDHIAASVAQSLQDIAVATRIPCVFGVITPLTEKQAVARTKGDMDRGKEAAEVALAMGRLRRELKTSSEAHR